MGKSAMLPPKQILIKEDFIFYKILVILLPITKH